MNERVPPLLSLAVIAGTYLVLTALELRRALRQDREPKPLRHARNLAIAGLGGVVMGLAEQPAVLPVARFVEAQHWGLLHWLRLPEPARIAAGVLLLDYTLYLWHVLTHKVPFLWRFHLSHHIDRDLDASTALRFHAGELLCSVPFRVAQVAFIGVSVWTYTLWQTLLFTFILFHHSNVRLPRRWEQALEWFLVTPHLHGIHHDARREHTDSNWSSGLSIWDRLHGTFKAAVPDSSVTIGIPAYQRPQDATLRVSLLGPFRPQRDDWRWNGETGSAPAPDVHRPRAGLESQ